MKTKEEKKEYMKRWYEANKEKIKEKNKKWREAHKGYFKNHYESHKEELKEWQKKHYTTHKEEHNKRVKRYQEVHKEEIIEYKKKYNEKYSKFQRYFRKDYSRFITLKNYIIIMKLKDEVLKKSIMIKLGLGTIDQDEAVAVSGMAFTDEDQKEIDEWFKTCKCKSNFS